MAENVSQAFLGLSSRLRSLPQPPARKMDQRSVLRVRQSLRPGSCQGLGGDSRNGDGKRTIVNASFGELVQPRTGKPQRPAPLDAAPLEFDAPGDRREYLAAWLTSPTTPSSPCSADYQSGLEKLLRARTG
jgi:ATPase subunit of ABC transporter with duplicated ATPase domains